VRTRLVGRDAPIRDAAPPHRRGAVHYPEPTSMIKPEPINAEQLDSDDRSMRLIEYVLALVALADAGILAFIR
jgi:hypothetical protein